PADARQLWLTHGRRPSPWHRAAFERSCPVVPFSIFVQRRMRMFWAFRRQRLRPTQRPRVPPSLEVLEGRALPSVSVIPFTDQPRLPPGAGGNTKGAAGQTPVFFKGQSVTINVKQLSDSAAASILAHNPRVQTIFVTNDLDEPQAFAPVLSAVPGQN